MPGTDCPMDFQAAETHNEGTAACECSLPSAEHEQSVSMGEGETGLL